MPSHAASGFRLSPQQRFLWMLGAEGQTRVAQCALLLEGPVESGALESALQRLIDRHEILRTRFHRLPGSEWPVQVVMDEGTITCRYLTCETRTADEHEMLVEKLLLEDRGLPFNLGQDLPIRATLGSFTNMQHLLILTLPSLCADAWTLGNLVKELSRLYGACARNQVTGDEVLQYADYAEFQHQLRQEPEAERGRDYWRDRGNRLMSGRKGLTGAQTNQYHSGEMVRLKLRLEDEDVVSLRRLAVAQGTNVPTILSACWQTLLWILTGQEQVVGQLYHGRVDDSLVDAFGRFCRLVPTLACFDYWQRFDGILNRVTHSNRGDELYQDFFEWELFSPGVERAVLPFGFILEPWVDPQVSAGVAFSIYYLWDDGEPSELSLSSTENGERLNLALLYDTKCVTPTDAMRIGRQLERLLSQVIKDPRLRLGGLCLLDQTERHQLLIEWNDTEDQALSGIRVDHLINRQSELNPDTVAVVFKDEHLSYRGLNEITNQLAHHLCSIGVGPGARVAIFLERSSTLIAAILGVIKAGGACVPLDPVYPKERLAFILEDTQAIIVLTQLSLVSELPESVNSRCLDREWASILRCSRENAEVESSGEELAYLVYTSGSTGTPKGVAIRHRSLCHYVKAIGEQLGLSREDACLHTALISFSASARQLFVPLASGCRLIMTTSAERKDPLTLSTIFQQLQITVWDTVPSLLIAVSDALIYRTGRSRAALADSSLRLISVTGEVLPPGVVAKWLSQLPAGARVVNLYGQSETTGTVILQPISDASINDRCVMPIGRPLANTFVLILNPGLQPVPVGVVGELYLSGASLARGYLDRALTAERFIPHPFSLEPGERLYQTGDLARRLPDGSIEFVSRYDDQVQIRGMRIQLKEIESLLDQHENVQRSIVMVRGDSLGERRLIAYFVPSSPQKPEGRELREFLKRRLPDDMVPATFVSLDALPLTPTGKVDRRALPEPNRAQPGPQSHVITPRTSLEKVIAAVWVELLNLEQIDINENFFDLGGHSLLVTQVLLRVQDTLQIEISLPQFFDAPTIAGLAKSILTGSTQPEMVEKTAGFILELSQTSDDDAWAS